MLRKEGLSAREKGMWFCLLLSLVLLPKAAHCAVDAIGTLTVVEGTVTVRKPGKQQVPAAVGDKLYVEDVISTGEKARAQVVLTDDSMLDLSTGTALRVNQYAFDSGRNRRTTEMKVLAGKARCVVFRARNNGSRFKVAAGHALIVTGVADFVAVVLPRETTVAVLSGSVRVQNISSLTVGQVRLGPNQTTSVAEKTPPSGPEIISREQRRTYSKDAHHS